MAVSGTTTFTLTRDDIIKYALRKLAVLDLGATPDATTITNAAQALDMMIKSWVSKGSKIWTIQELVIPTVANQNTYYIGPAGSYPTLDLVTDKPLYLMQGFIRNTGVTPNVDIPLMVISYNDYNRLTTKGATGTPNSLELQVLRDYSILRSFVTPDTVVAGTFQYHIFVKRLIQDAGIATNNLDFPQEWLYALGWNLAAEMCADYDIPPQKVQYIESKAAKFLAEIEDFDVEQTSVFFTPAQQWTR